MIRLFTAIEIPQLISSQLTGLQIAGPGWDPGWVAEATFHITIAYAGEVEEPLAEDLDTELRQIRASGFELEIKGVDAFGGKRPQVLYAAVTKPPELEYLFEKHHSVLRRLGIESEARRYVPHVTLGRPRHPPFDRVQDWIAANNLYASGRFPVDRVVLFSSHKLGDGRHYEPERDYPLGPHLLKD